MGKTLWNKSGGREALEAQCQYGLLWKPCLASPPGSFHCTLNSPGFLSLMLSERLLSPEVGPIASASARAPTVQFLCSLSFSVLPHDFGLPA